MSSFAIYCPYSVGLRVVASGQTGRPGGNVMDKRLREVSWRAEETKEKAILQELLGREQSQVLIREFEKNDITEPCLEEGAAFTDKETGKQYAFIPFRSPKTGEIHAALEGVGNDVRGVYVSLDEQRWDNFIVLSPGKDRAVSQAVPWTAFRDPGKSRPLIAATRDRGVATLKPGRQEAVYSGLFLLGAAQIAMRNKALGYYMMIAVCAV
jgi:hypothetical protein